MTSRVDNHSHILLADITGMVASAHSVSVVEFSITEHVSQFRELREAVKFGSVHSYGRTFRSFDEYNKEFHRLSETAQDVIVNRGLEVDYSPRFEGQIGQFVDQDSWDILLCSVHEFDNSRDVEKNIAQCSEEEINERWQAYFNLQQMALESNFVPFNVLAHPVRMSRGLAKPPPDMDKLLLALATTSKRRGKALELNGKDIANAPQLVRRLAHACETADCQVSLGSDAHSPRDVHRNLEQPMDLVEEYKLRTYRPSNER
jgi:HisJ family histidinol phosphate phosphatase